MFLLVLAERGYGLLNVGEQGIKKDRVSLKLASLGAQEAQILALLLRKFKLFPSALKSR